MEREELYRKLSVTNEKKLVLVVLDGLGGIPVKGKTELETAQTPNLDFFASGSELGLSHPLGIGITPGSGPAHLSLFGYDPFKYEIGRGILEALGVGIPVTKKDVTARGNFATLENNLIVDRRAGRISTEKNREIVTFLNERLQKIDDVDVRLCSGEEHRFVLVMTGENLSDALTDADPEGIGLPIKYAMPKDDISMKTADVVNQFIDTATSLLGDFHPANTCLLRGFAKYPMIPSMTELFKLKPAAIASYPMYRGLAQLVGMDILETGKTIEDQIKTLKANYSKYDFFFIHVKKTDSYGEDGNFDAKVKVIEEFDYWLPAIMELFPGVMVVTGDHSTPAAMKSHSWHPNPFLIQAAFQRTSFKQNLKFGERTCAEGILGNFQAIDILPMMMANALKLKKYGA